MKKPVKDAPVTTADLAVRLAAAEAAAERYREKARLREAEVASDQEGSAEVDGIPEVLSDASAAGEGPAPAAAGNPLDMGAGPQMSPVREATAAEKALQETVDTLEKRALDLEAEEARTKQKLIVLERRLNRLTSKEVVFGVDTPDVGDTDRD